MDLLAKQGCEFVAVFDADFKPDPGFLQRTVPYLMGNPEVGAAPRLANTSLPRQQPGTACLQLRAGPEGHNVRALCCRQRT